MASQVLPETRQALVTATATLLATLAAFAMEEMENPWWATFSVFVISHGDQRQVLLKGAMRMVGIIALSASASILGFAPKVILVLQATVLFVTAFFFTRQRFASKFAYAWLIGMLMIVMMVFISILEPGSLREFAYARIFEVGLGVAVCTLVNHFLLGGVAKPRPGADEGEHFIVHQDRGALLAATVILSVPILWSWLELPSMVQIGLTILAMIDRDVFVTRSKSGLQILGCFVGDASGSSLSSPVPVRRIRPCR